MNCIICGTNDWENVDEMRIKKAGMCMCKTCGFVSYPDKYKSPEELKAFYRKDYRPAPTHQNVFTCQRKNQMHEAFLNELFAQWQQMKINPVITEVGAAFGMALNLFKQFFPQGDIAGTEWTTSMRRVAWQEFGIRLTDDIDTSKKYNLIMSYKVAEHQLDIDKHLATYRELLDDKHGFLYISVPTWFDNMINFGLQGFDLEYYYEPAHINVWTRRAFESLLAKVGFKIVKEDHVMYGSTYLCMKDDPKPIEEFHKPEEIKKRMAAIKSAYTLFKEGKYGEALNHYPAFPIAWSMYYEMGRKDFHRAGYEATMNSVARKAIEVCGESPDILGLAADISARFGKYHEAERFVKRSLELKPGNPASIGMMCNIMREMALRAPPEKKEALWLEARDWANELRLHSLESNNSGIDMAFLFASQVPTPDEQLTEYKAKMKPPEPIPLHQSPQ